EPARIQAQRGVARAGQGRVHLLQLGEAGRQAVVVVDVPIDLGGVLLDLLLDAARRIEAADVDVVDIAGDALGLGDLLGGDVDEEEQLVLDDRATEGAAVGALVVEAGERRAAGRVVTDHVGVAVHAVQRAVELVGAGLGHRVDHRAGGAGDGGVVVGDVDVDRLDGVHRDRLAHGREVVRLQTEGVAGVHAVDADGVVARVLATDGQLAARLVGLRHARVEADVVLDVAVDRRQSLDLLLLDAGARAHLVGAEHFRATREADHLHRAQAGDVTGQRCVDGADLVQGQVHALLGLGAFAGLGLGHGVRTTHAQAAGVVAAAGVGGGTADGTGLDVGNGHFGAGNRLAAGAGHHATDTGGGALGEDGGSGKGGDQSKGELGHAKSTVISHG